MSLAGNPTAAERAVLYKLASVDHYRCFLNCIDMRAPSFAATCIAGACAATSPHVSLIGRVNSHASVLTPVARYRTSQHLNIPISPSLSDQAAGAVVRKNGVGEWRLASDIDAGSGITG